MEPTHDEQVDGARQDALAFLLHNKVGVLATTEEDHSVHASTIYYVADNDFNIYFLTRINTRKFKAIQEHPQVAFTVSSAEVPQTVQIEGMAMDISLDQDQRKKQDELFKILNAHEIFYAPLIKLDPAPLVMVWIRPTWIRWADYAFEQSGDRNIFKEISVTS